MFTRLFGTKGRVLIDPFRSMAWAIVALTTQATAQQYQWAAVYNESNLYLRGVATAPDGAVYVAGYFQGTMDMDPGPGTTALSAVQGDAVVIRFEANGQFAWARNIGGSLIDGAADVAVAPNGDVLVVGYFTGTADLDPGSGTLNATSTGSQDVFVVRLDPSGDLVWARTLGGTMQQQASDITVDPQGNIWMAGSIFGSADFDPGAGSFILTAPGIDAACWLWKLDASGALLWAGLLNGVDGVNNAISIATNSGGELFATGRFNTQADMDPGPGNVGYTAGGSSVGDGFLLKLSASGGYLWSHHIAPSGGAPEAWGMDLATDDNGNVIATGRLIGSYDFDPGPGTNILTGDVAGDAFVWKVDGNGGMVWARLLGGSSESWGVCAATDLSGHVHMAGSFDLDADMDPGPGVVQVTAVGSPRLDIYMSTLDPTGSYVWSGSLGADLDDAPFDMETDADGNIVLIGDIQGNVDLDPGSGTAMFSALTSLGHRSKFVLKLGAIPLAVEQHKTSECGVYPIPASDLITITTDHPSLRAIVEDTRGAIVIERQITGPAAQLDLRSLAAGTYLLHLETGQGRIVRVLVKE